MDSAREAQLSGSRPHLRPPDRARAAPATPSARRPAPLQAHGRVRRARARERVGRRARRDARRRREEVEAMKAVSSSLRAEATGAKPRPSAATWAASSTPLHRERDQLAGRRASLEELVATHGAFDAGVRALLDDRGDLRVLGRLADTIEVAPEYEKAVEGFLGDALQALVVPNAETARARGRAARRIGRGPRLVPDPRTARPAPARRSGRRPNGARIVGRSDRPLQGRPARRRTVKLGLCDVVVRLDGALGSARRRSMLPS